MSCNMTYNGMLVTYYGILKQHIALNAYSLLPIDYYVG